MILNNIIRIKNKYNSKYYEGMEKAELKHTIKLLLTELDSVCKGTNDTSVCDSCGQKKPKIMKYGLSKNLIKVLWTIRDLSFEKGHMKTEELYDINNKGSNTAFLTQLKYFGLVQPHYDMHETKKESQRSGKWKITLKGEYFLKGKGFCEKWVEVVNQSVLEKGSEINIFDKYLKWKTEDEIWKFLKGEEA